MINTCNTLESLGSYKLRSRAATSLVPRPSKFGRPGYEARAVTCDNNIWSWVLMFNAHVCIFKHMYRLVYGYGFTYLGYPWKLKCKNGWSDQSAKIFTLENFPLFKYAFLWIVVLSIFFPWIIMLAWVSPSITSSADSCSSITAYNWHCHKRMS